MISYAQNAEDAVLARLFTSSEGFYVDVGAGHPVNDSVTKLFYDRGWTGLNIEPMRQMFELLREQRPRDINVQMAISDRCGHATLYEARGENLGASTLSESLAREQQEATGQPSFIPTTIETATLASLLERFGVARIDFLKIDAEGHETPIILSTEWSRVRPRVLVVEAVKPVTAEPAHGDWEPALLAAGYVCTLFDGVNRFYAFAEDDEARAALSTPANAFDDIEPWRWVSQLEGAKAHVAAVEEARQRAERYAQELHRAGTRLPLRTRVIEGVRRLRKTYGIAPRR